MLANFDVDILVEMKADIQRLLLNGFGHEVDGWVKLHGNNNCRLTVVLYA